MYGFKGFGAVVSAQEYLQNTMNAIAAGAPTGAGTGGNVNQTLQYALQNDYCTAYSTDPACSDPNAAAALINQIAGSNGTVQVPNVTDQSYQAQTVETPTIPNYFSPPPNPIAVPTINPIPSQAPVVVSGAPVTPASTVATPIYNQGPSIAPVANVPVSSGNDVTDWVTQNWPLLAVGFAGLVVLNMMRK